MTILPGVTTDGRDGRVGIDMAGGDGDASGQTQFFGPERGQTSDTGAGRHDGSGHTRGDDVFESGVESGQKRFRRKTGLFAPLRFVARRTGVAGLDSGELPDDPVRRFDQALGSIVDFGGFIEYLPGLGKKPFRGNLTSVVGQEALFQKRGGALKAVASGCAA